MANKPPLSSLDLPGFAPIKMVISEVVKGAPVLSANSVNSSLSLRFLRFALSNLSSTNPTERWIFLR